jgi:hypothetical protein
MHTVHNGNINCINNSQSTNTCSGSNSSSVKDDQLSIHLIVTQTNYTEAEAVAKLKQFNGNHMHVIREYMGLPVPSSLNADSVTELEQLSNADRYRELRHFWDIHQEKYQQKHDITASEAQRLVAQELDQSEATVTDSTSIDKLDSITDSNSVDKLTDSEPSLELF